MKCKSILSLILAVVLCCLILCACQPAPEEEVVISKQEINATNAPEADRVEGPQKLILKKDSSFTSTDESVTFTWNVDKTIDIPDISTVNIRPHYLTSQECQTVVEAVLGDAVVYDLGLTGIREYTKDELQDIIGLLTQYLDEQKLQQLLGDMADYNGLKNALDEANRQYEQAPAEMPYPTCSWDLTGEHGFDPDVVLRATAKLDGIDYEVSVSQHNDPAYQKSSIGIWLGDGNQNNRIVTDIVRARLCRTEKPTQAQIDAAAEKTREIVAQLGLGSFEVAETKVLTVPSGDADSYTILVRAVPIIGGAPALGQQWSLAYKNSDQFVYNYGLLDAHFTFNAEGQLIGGYIGDFIEATSTDDKKVSILPADAVIERAQKQLELYDAESLQTFDMLIMGISAEGLDCRTSIEDIEFGMGRIKAPDDPYGYMYVPAFSFKGRVEFFSNESGEFVSGDDATELNTLFTINAIDGTVIG